MKIRIAILAAASLAIVALAGVSNLGVLFLSRPMW